MLQLWKNSQSMHPPFLVGKKLNTHYMTECLLVQEEHCPQNLGFLEIVYDHDLNEHGNATESTAIYTYR